MHTYVNNTIHKVSLVAPPAPKIHLKHLLESLAYIELKLIKYSYLQSDTNTIRREASKLVASTLGERDCVLFDIESRLQTRQQLEKRRLA